MPVPEPHRRPTWLSWITGSCVLALTVAAVWGLPRLSFDDNYMEVFRNEKPEYKQYEQLLETFGSDDMDCYILVERENILADDSVRTLRRIHDDLQALSDVERVFSIFSTRTKKRVGRYLLPVFSYELDDPERIERGRTEIREHPIAKGTLLDGSESATLIIARLKGKTLSVAEIAPLLERLREAIEKATAGTDLKASVTGVPAIRVEITRSVRRDNILFTACGLALACVVALFLFRRIPPMLIVSIAPSFGVLWTLGAMSWWGESLNVINVIVPALLIVIGFTDSVHIMFHIRRLRDEGVTAVTAARSAVREVGPACVLTSITTAIGFGSLAFSEDNVISRFGITSAFGTTVTMLAVLAIVPLLSVTPLGRHCLSPPGSRRAGRENRRHRLLDFVLAYPRRITLATALFVVAMLYGSLQLQADFRYGENMPADHETQRSLRRCDDLFGGASTVYAVVQVPPKRSLRDPKLHQMLAAVHAVFDRHAETSLPLSLRNLLESLPGKGELHRRIGHLRYLPKEVLANFVNTETRQVLVTARTPDLGARQMKPVFDAIRAELADVDDSFEDYQVHLVGMPVMATYLSKQMIRDLARSLQLASISIFAVLMITLGSVRLGLRSLLPNVFPLAALGATLYLSGRPLMYSGVICFSICLGIAVDDTIHFLVRYRRELARDGDVRGAIRRTHEKITPVLITTTILMLAGFGTTLLSALPTIWMFGALSCAALIYALAGDLVILPALLAASIPTDAPRGSDKAARRAGFLARPLLKQLESHPGRNEFRLVAVFAGPLNREQIHADLANLVARTPILTHRLSENRLWWFPDEQFSIDRQVREISIGANENSDVVDGALQASGNALPADRPLWRVDLVQGSGPADAASSCIVIRLHSSWIDAKSALELFEPLLGGAIAATPSEIAEGKSDAVADGRVSSSLFSSVREWVRGWRLQPSDDRWHVEKATAPSEVHFWTVPRSAFCQSTKDADCNVAAAILAAITGGIRDFESRQGTQSRDTVISWPIPRLDSGTPLAASLSNLHRVRLPVAEPDEAARVRQIAMQLDAIVDGRAQRAHSVGLQLIRRLPGPLRDRLLTRCADRTDFNCQFIVAAEGQPSSPAARRIDRFIVPARPPRHGIAIGVVVGTENVSFAAEGDPSLLPAVVGAGTAKPSDDRSA